MKKKAQIQVISGIILSLLILGIILTVGVKVLSQTRDTSATITSLHVVNETVCTGCKNATDYTIDYGLVNGGTKILLNGTTKIIVPTGNYSVSAGDRYTPAVISFNDAKWKFEGKTLRLSYYRNAYGYDDAGNSTASVISTIGQIPTWLPVIVIVIIAGVILALVKVFQQ